MLQVILGMIFLANDLTGAKPVWYGIVEFNVPLDMGRMTQPCHSTKGQWPVNQVTKPITLTNHVSGPSKNKHNYDQVATQKKPKQLMKTTNICKTKPNRT